ncbi:MAG: TonB-dependent receptor [Bacteroidota bacterium]
MHKNTIVFLLAVFITQCSVFAQSSGSLLSGKITDEKGTPLIGATVVVRETRNGTTTDNSGEYKLLLQPGNYTLDISFIGYEKQNRKVQVRPRENRSEHFALVSTSFRIGEILVSPPGDFNPAGSDTRTKVSSSEIEHIQAASLSDVMKLMPGSETTNPSLQSSERATIRGGDALGTQIMLDGVPVSNNANMQVGMTGSSAGTGIDLRSIPADNIKEVEIIRGIPSVQYGDLTDGIVIVKTKTAADPYRLKMKYNPQLYEANVSGGIKSGFWVLNANFNVASSQRDIRIDNDGYTRLAGQITAAREAENYSLSNILYVTRAFDERKEQPGYALKEASYNRDLNIKYTGNASYNYSPFGIVKGVASVSYTKQDSYNQELLSRDNIVVSDRTSEGTQEGRIMFGSYLGKKWVKGDVWNLYADLNISDKFYTGDYLHSVTGGLSWKDDFNNGSGVVFDPLYPPTLNIPLPRLRSYSDLPDYQQVSLYAEDKITGRLVRPFTLTIGLRYESYRPEGLSLKGRNGSFLNPRVTLSYSLLNDTQIRLGYGVTSKSAPMSMIFAQKFYYDLVDTVSVVDPSKPEKNFSVVSTYIREQANPDIKGYTQKKYEASIDQQFEFGGISITGFYNKSEDMFESASTPVVFYKKSYPVWPDASAYTIKDTLYDSYNMYINAAWQKTSGVEFIVHTKRIPLINTVVSIDGAYNYTETGSKQNIAYGLKKYSSTLNATVVPVYTDYSTYTKELLINYRFEIQARSLGMWLTIHVQQKPVDIDGRKGYGDSLAVGYYNSAGKYVNIPEDQRSSAVYSQLKRTVYLFNLREEDRPNKWLLNLKLSKSLWKSGVISFFVNNLFNDHPLYRLRRRADSSPSFEKRNPDIFYGLEFSTSIGRQ